MQQSDVPEHRHVRFFGKVKFLGRDCTVLWTRLREAHCKQFAKRNSDPTKVLA